MTVESVWTALHLSEFHALSRINMMIIDKCLLERIGSALCSMLLLGGETKTEWLCHLSHTNESTMASRNPETKQHRKVLKLKDRVQTIKKSQQG